MMALGDNIRKLREERGMTQQQMADKLYVSRQTVCRWENGSRCPDLITAKKIATEFGVSLDVLISDDDLEDLERISGAGKFTRYKKTEAPGIPKEDTGIYPGTGRRIPVHLPYSAGSL